jgi:hypothetical protein
MVRTTVAGTLVLLPLQAWMAHGFYAPYARASQAIDRAGADLAIVGAGDAPFSLDLVINRADLSNRPVRLIAETVDEQLIGQLCRAGPTVALVGDHVLAEISAIFGNRVSTRAAERNAALAPTLRTAGCQVSVLQ